MSDIDFFIEILDNNNIQYNQDMLDKLERYYSYLIEYNQNVNLTTITQKNDVYLKHFADSLLGLRYIKPNDSVCDIGTGAGFPGVVLKIFMPGIKLFLVDSLQKRVTFLQNLVKLLQLDNVTIIHARAEDSSFKKIYLNSFDCVVARAVAQMPTLCEYCLPFVEPNGIFIAYKSTNSGDEVESGKKAIESLGGKLEKIDNIQLADGICRDLIIIKKVKKSSSLYPRGQNKPRLKPII